MMTRMTLFDAIILGIVEGFTEFLPISSTGHQILASHLLGLDDTEFLKSFEIVVQLGAILAVVVIYFRKFLEIELLKKLLVAFIPTGAVGIAMYPFIKNVFLGSELLVVWALLLGGIALIIFEYFHTEGDQDTVESITYGQAALIGLAQSIAVIPGVSRSAASILGGLLMGIKRAAIVEFSFLLAVPTIAAATGLDVLRNYETLFSGGLPLLATGFVVSFLVAIVAIRFLLAFVRQYTFVPFGAYRIIVALLFIFLVL